MKALYQAPDQNDQGEEEEDAGSITTGGRPVEIPEKYFLHEASDPLVSQDKIGEMFVVRG